MKLWQKCPVCNGVGQVSCGYFARAGDCETWAATDTIEVCKVCQGFGIIQTPEQEEVKG